MGLCVCWVCMCVLDVEGCLLQAEGMQLPWGGRDQRVEPDPREGEGTEEIVQKTQREGEVSVEGPVPMGTKAGGKRAGCTLGLLLHRGERAQGLAAVSTDLRQQSDCVPQSLHSGWSWWWRCPDLGRMGPQTCREYQG